ncbi:unnamed protein product [Polarella glacialis]|uniref:Amino acid transporter transmembrane domain-containing protein n=1 Tax=Polarella glacialis TaxID=89957 RepID=A0A813F2H9_POLGL|nr:unnamed protein product [Polarella glacialis]
MGSGQAPIGRRQSWAGRTFGPMQRGSLRSSIVTLMSAATGSGVLLLPYAFSLVGLPLGLLCLLFARYCTEQSLRLIMTISQVTGCDSYAKSASAVLGPSVGKMLACIMVGEAMCNLASVLKLSSNLWARVLPSLLAGLTQVERIAVVVAMVFPACASRDLSSLRHVTVISPVSLVFVAALVVGGALRGNSELALLAPLVPGQERGLTPESVAAASVSLEVLRSGRGGPGVAWAELPRAWSVVLNSFSCQHVAVPVYRQLHKADSRRVNKVLLRSTTYLTVLYGLVAVCGVITYGQYTPENILLAYPEDDRAAQIAQTLVGCSMLVVMPLAVHHARDQLPQLLEGLGLQLVFKRVLQLLLSPCLLLRLCLRRPLLRRWRAWRPASEKVRGVEDAPAVGGVSSEATASSSRVLHTSFLLGIPVFMAIVFPSVTSLVGIATGFGSVLWTSVMPVVMVFVLRLLSDPLASPPCSPRSSPSELPPECS